MAYSNSLEFVFAVSTFLVLIVWSNLFGQLLVRVKFPLITSYLVAGVIIGPYALDILHESYLPHLNFVNQFALAVIAFCAGAELYFPEIRQFFKTIILQMTGIFVSTLILVTGVIAALSSQVDFMKQYPFSCRLSISLLCGAIMVARSPSSALAIVSELRASGPMTKTLLGITVVSDIVLLVSYAITAAIAHAECTGGGLDGYTVLILVGTLAACAGSGYVLGKLLVFYLWIPGVSTPFRGLLILPSGYGFFVLSKWLATYTFDHLGREINLEPLLVCMVAAAIAANESKNRRKFANLLHKSSPYIFLPFFLLTGASLDLSALNLSFLFALIVYSLRAFAIWFGSYVSGRAWIKLPPVHYKYLWLTLLTQAGAALGLANEISVKFPGWGKPFAAAIISCVVLNQVVGPFLFKYGMGKMGEGKASSSTTSPGNVLILGISWLSVSLAKRLQAIGCDVTLVPVKHAHTSSKLMKEIGASVVMPSKLNNSVPDCTERHKFDVFHWGARLWHRLWPSQGAGTVPGAIQLLPGALPIFSDMLKQCSPSSASNSVRKIPMKRNGADVNNEKNGLNNHAKDEAEIKVVDAKLQTDKSTDRSSTAHKVPLLSQDAMGSSDISDIEPSEITPVQRAVESLLPLSNAAAIVFMLPSDAEALRWCECITTLNKELRVVVHVHQANHAREFIKYGALVTYTPSALAQLLCELTVTRSSEPVLLFEQGLSVSNVGELIRRREVDTRCVLNITSVPTLVLPVTPSVSPVLKAVRTSHSISTVDESNGNHSEDEKRQQTSSTSPIQCRVYGSPLRQLGIADSNTTSPPLQHSLPDTVTDRSKAFGVVPLTTNLEKVLRKRRSKSRFNQLALSPRHRTAKASMHHRSRYGIDSPRRNARPQQQSTAHGFQFPIESPSLTSSASSSSSRTVTNKLRKSKTLPAQFGVPTAHAHHAHTHTQQTHTQQQQRQQQQQRNQTDDQRANTVVNRSKRDDDTKEQ